MTRSGIVVWRSWVPVSLVLLALLLMALTVGVRLLMIHQQWARIRALEIAGTEIDVRECGLLEMPVTCIEYIAYDQHYTVTSLPELGQITAIVRIATNVESLYLSGAEVRDSDLRQLRQHRHLRELSLSDTQITDRGVAYLADLPRLRFLNLSGTHVTDDGVALLTAAESLWFLDINDTKVSPRGVDSLRKAHGEELTIVGPKHEARATEPKP